MAERPVFYVADNKIIRRKLVDFEWFSGFAVSQKRKCIASLHSALDQPALEVSTKGEVPFGNKLSAFNLKLNGYTLENIFQSSKVFEKGGPYRDLLDVSPKDAKRDVRLKESGKLTGFEYEGFRWALLPKTAFYDYIYCRAVRESVGKVELAQIQNYKYFSDIEFNPNKSLNTQARSAAIVRLFMDLYGEIPDLTPEEFLKFHKTFVI